MSDTPHTHDGPQAVDFDADRVRSLRRLGVVLAVVGALAIALGAWLYGRGGGIGPVLPADPGALGPALERRIEEAAAEVRAAPRDARVHANLGLLYEANLLWDEARASYQRAAELEPDEVTWGYHAALCELGAEREGNAFAEMVDLLARHPDFVPLAWRVADLTLARGESEAAAELFERVSRLAPDDPEGPTGQGAAALARGEPEQALAHFERALELDAGYGAARYQRGLALARLGRESEAAADLAAGGGGRVRAPSDAWGARVQEFEVRLEPRLARALALQNAGDLPGAEAIFVGLAEDYPDDVRVVNDLGFARLLQERAEEALADFERAAELDPESVTVLINLSSTHLALEQGEPALAAARHAVELAPGSAAAHLHAGRALFMLRRPEEGLPSVREAARLASTDADLQSELAQALLVVGRNDEARAQFELLCELLPGRWEPRADLASLCLDLGDREAARRVLDEALLLAPDAPALRALEARLVALQER